MIFEKLIELILQLPFFSQFELSGRMLDSAESIFATVSQVNDIINLSLLVNTFFYALGLYVVVGIVRVIIDLL